MSDSVRDSEFWSQFCIFVEMVVLGHEHQLAQLKIVRRRLSVEVLLGLVSPVFVDGLGHLAHP